MPASSQPRTGSRPAPIPGDARDTPAAAGRRPPLALLLALPLLPLLPLLLLLLSLLGGCAGHGWAPAPGARTKTGASATELLARARGGGWSEYRIRSGKLVLAAWTSAATGEDVPVIFIEGDGHAWLSRHQPSPDPTPRNPVGLALALAHPGRAAYLARPCQYLADSERGGCRTALWTHARFSEEVVAAMSDGVAALRRSLRAERVILAGFSGGGGIAVLVAARRDDVAGVISIAGNLDHAAWTRAHNVSPLTASLNPADHAATLASLPQVIFSGERDEVVPPAIAHAYRARFPADAPLHLETIAGAGHRCCWAHAWPGLYHRAGMHLAATAVAPAATSAVP